MLHACNRVGCSVENGHACGGGRVFAGRSECVGQTLTDAIDMPSCANLAFFWAAPRNFSCTTRSHALAPQLQLLRHPQGHTSVHGPRCSTRHAAATARQGRFKRPACLASASRHLRPLPQPHRSSRRSSAHCRSHRGSSSAPPRRLASLIAARSCQLQLRTFPSRSLLPIYPHAPAP